MDVQPDFYQRVSLAWSIVAVQFEYALIKINEAAVELWTIFYIRLIYLSAFFVENIILILKLLSILSVCSIDLAALIYISASILVHYISGEAWTKSLHDSRTNALFEKPLSLFSSPSFYSLYWVSSLSADMVLVFGSINYSPDRLSCLHSSAITL